MIPRILVPVDFSEQATLAAQVASNIAKKTSSKIYLLHMIELPSGVVDMGSGSVSSTPASLLFLEKVHERFDEFVASSFFEGVEVHQEVRFHKAFDGVIEYTKELNIGLIVMGSHGVSGVKEMLVGSNTEKVVRTSEVPVLVVKDNTEINHFVEMTYASDFSKETEGSFHKVLDFASIFDSTLHCLYVNTASNFQPTHVISSRMKAFLSKYDYKKITLNIYNDRNIENGIINFSKTKDVGAICIHTHGRSGLSNFLNGSIGEDLVNHALKPVITFKL